MRRALPTRGSIGWAFLARAEGRSNLEVMTDAQVQRVILDGRRAVGVYLGNREVRLRDAVPLASAPWQR